MPYTKYFKVDSYLKPYEFTVGEMKTENRDIRCQSVIDMKKERKCKVCSDELEFASSSI